jgi:predicted DNA-binding transcriptional regulator AlpA
MKGRSNRAAVAPDSSDQGTTSTNNNVVPLKTPRLLAPRGLPRTDAAFYIGCSPRMFDGMVKKGEMPSPRLIGTKKVWDRDELDEFFADLPRPQTNGDQNDWDEGG